MKPTKNKIFCKDCGRVKMKFETKIEADTFISFNSENIESENGYSPDRSYYCMFCGEYHVTSKNDVINIKSKTERIIELYNQDKEKKVLQRENLLQNSEKSIS
jgi:hypothetical protein